MICRIALSHIVERTLALAGYLAEGGAKKTHNVDNLLLRESMDVIGQSSPHLSPDPCSLCCSDTPGTACLGLSLVSIAHTTCLLLHRQWSLHVDGHPPQAVSAIYNTVQSRGGQRH